MSEIEKEARSLGGMHLTLWETDQGRGCHMGCPRCNQESAMRRVVAAERERCAKLAESFKAYGSYTEKNSKMPSRAIAAAIRKGIPE